MQGCLQIQGYLFYQAQVCDCEGIESCRLFYAFIHVSIIVYSAHVLSIFCLYVDVLYARIRYV